MTDATLETQTEGARKAWECRVAWYTFEVSSAAGAAMPLLSISEAAHLEPYWAQPTRLAQLTGYPWWLVAGEDRYHQSIIIANRYKRVI